MKTSAHELAEKSVQEEKRNVSLAGAGDGYAAAAAVAL